MRENVECFSNCLSINVIRSYLCKTKELCCFAPVVLNEIGKINAICEGFVITETHGTYTVLDVNVKEQKSVYAIFADEFMTQKILGCIEIHRTRIFYGPFHSKLNLETSLICKWNVLYPIINSMIITKNEEILNYLFEKVKD